MDFLNPELVEYAEAHTYPESPLLKKLDRDTNLKALYPKMLSGHLQGRLLSMISHMIKPDRILEIGTYTGYSAICLAEGMLSNGELVTIDINRELSDIVKGYLEDAGIQDRVQVLHGDALQILPTLSGPFDLVFLDADKQNYSRYFDLIIDKVPPGGFILADNVLWYGKVLESGEKVDKETRGILDFNHKVHKDSRVENLLLPIRDGIMILRRI